MYAKPCLDPLDPAVAVASCCRVVVTSGDSTLLDLTNRPLCPFPAPTGTVCVSADPASVTTTSGVLAVTTVCAYPS